MFKKILLSLVAVGFALFLFSVGLISIAILNAYPKLPNLDAVTQYKPKIPLTIYSSDQQIIGIFGEERRAFTQIEKFPDILKNAVIAAEDKRFYEHWGVDVWGIARAVVGNVISGKIESGASTLTQQVARNFFLNNERTFTRKFNEALMAYKIERSLTKDQILELYFNQIYLGQRAYGFAAASQIYFGKNPKDLTLAEAAMLAGLPKAPSSFNPIANPKRAQQRQHYILNNMLDLGMITPEQHAQALKEQLTYKKFRDQTQIDNSALYVAEMVRQTMFEKYGEAAYTSGFSVYTTVSVKNQKAATAALRQTLEDYSRGQPFHGAESQVDLSKVPADQRSEKALQALEYFHTVSTMIPAIVIDAQTQKLTLLAQGFEQPIELKDSQIAFVKKAILNEKMGSRQIKLGSILRLIQDKKGNWSITQQPELQGALVSTDPRTGAILALVGGYDFYQKEFNRATQAYRQPGSTFKPFVYSAALQRGMTASTLINDAPISFAGLGPNGEDWNPKNSNNRYDGLMTLHNALVASKNVVSVRIMQAIGSGYTHEYIQRFGFAGNKHPINLSLTLGSGSTTPLEMARAYSVFANGGYRIAPYFIDKIYDNAGNLLAQTQPLTARKDAPLVIDPRNAFIMSNILKDVTRVGTAASASSLNRSDIAGKTGTTNEQKDAWFVGFTPRIVTAVYIGFDQPRNMGKRGFGGKIALPVWIQYMRHALQDVPVTNLPMPSGVMSANGEYYYSEWTQTNPSLKIDNSGLSDDVLQMLQEDSSEEIQLPGTLLEPINTTPAPNATPAKPQSGQHLDSLF